MSTFQHAKKLAIPAATPIAMAATSFLGGKHASAQTSAKLSSQTSKSFHTLLATRSLPGSHNNFMRHSCNMHTKQRSFASAPPVAAPAAAVPKASSGAATPPSSSASHGSFVAWYEHHLKHRPVVTKAITGSILWGVGDVVAQVVPKVFFDDASEDTKQEVKSSSVLAEYDYERTGRAMFFGFAIHAPLSHVHYNFLEWMTVKGGFTGLSIPVFKTVMEQVRDVLFGILKKV